MTLQEEITRRRTFAVIAHPDAGKTTLTEKLLLFGGAIHVAGAVKSNKIKKGATSDFMEIERQRGISVATSVMGFEYQGRKINILDTPGHEDFAEDTYRTLTAVDSVIIVINGAKGVLVNVTGSMDIGLEEVEIAANLVQQAAHPDALIIFGAAFDDTLEDEIRVTVIATGFDEKDEPAAMGAKPFSAAGAKVEEQQRAASPAAQYQAPAAPAPEPEKAAVSDDDWDILERIFSRKR